MFHQWVSCDDGCATCLVCGAHYEDARIDDGDVGRCTGNTSAIHGYSGEQWCDTCRVTAEPDNCPHLLIDCDCDFCR